MLKSSVLILSVLSLTDLSTARVRVIGGKFAKKGQFPHQVSIHLRGRHVCGGPIIAENIILTAAHCTYRQNPADLKVIAGTNNLSSTDRILANVETYTIHPNYNPCNQDNDVAIVYLKEHLPIGSNPNVKTIELVESTKELLVAKEGTICGWGQVKKHSIFSPRTHILLKYARIPIWDYKTCSDIIYENFEKRLKPSMFCAGTLNGQISVCPEDSGGPLVVNGKVVGLVSGGPGYGNEGPGIYSNLGTMRSWIKQMTNI